MDRMCMVWRARVGSSRGNCFVSVSVEHVRPSKYFLETFRLGSVQLPSKHLKGRLEFPEMSPACILAPKFPRDAGLITDSPCSLENWCSLGIC